MVDVDTTDIDKMDHSGNRSYVSNSSTPSQAQSHTEYLSSRLQLGGIIQEPQIQGVMKFDTSLPAYPDKYLKEPRLAAHKIDQKFICNVCGIGLSRKDHLGRHLLCHRNDRPYSCGVCSKKFKRSEHLSRHTLIHIRSKVQKMGSASNGDGKTIKVINLDSDDEDQHLSNLKPVPDKPKNFCNNSGQNMIPKDADVLASTSLMFATEFKVQSSKTSKCDYILPINLSDAEDTESENEIEFVTCDDNDQFAHCDKGATSCVQCYNLLLSEAPPDVNVLVDPMAKNDLDEMDWKYSWSERPAADIKFMVDPVMKTDPDRLDLKHSWSERPPPDIKFMVDPVRKTDPDEMDQKVNQSVVPASSPPPDIKDTADLSRLLQLGEVDQKPHKSWKQKEGDVRFITFPNGTRYYFCPKCPAAYHNTNLLELHLMGHKIERRFICNVCGASLTSKEHLVRHLLNHSDEQPYSCGLCSKTFKQLQQLSRHSCVHFSHKPKKITRASYRDDETVSVNTTDSVGEDQTSSNLKRVPGKPKNNSDNVTPKQSGVTTRSSLLPATDLTKQNQRSHQCDTVSVSNPSEAVDTGNEISQTEFVTCYNRVFVDHVTNLCTKMGDLIFLSIKEEGSYEQRLVATNKITCQQLRGKEKEILKTKFLQVYDKYKVSFATMFRDVVAIVLSNASTVKLQKILLLSWFLKLFVKITSELLPELSDSPTLIWKKIIGLLSSYEHPTPIVEEVFSLSEVDFEKECWKTLDLIQHSFC